MSSQRPSPDADSEDQRGPTVRDKRRIDPKTYELREPATSEGQPREPQETAAPAAGGPSAAPAAGGPVQAADGELAETKASLAERTADLQRLQAEYVNYKRRVDRDREVARNQGIQSVLKDFLSVLDDIRSAREHEELSGGFKAVAEEVERIATKYGLESYGTKGEPFDPHIHEALLHAHGEGIDGPTCVEILQPGYRIGDRILRPARVAVAEPDPAASEAPAAPESPNTTESPAAPGTGADEPQPGND